MNVEPQNNSNSNSELIHREKIENTPFWVIGNEKGGYFLIMGRYKITWEYKTVKEAKEALENEKWNIILRLVGTILEAREEEEKHPTTT